VPQPLTHASPCSELRMQGDTPCLLFDGPLLGVAVKRATSTAEAFGEEGMHALQLFSWDSQKRVGVDLAEPTWLSWDPTFSMVALGYPQQVRQGPVMCLGAGPDCEGAVWCWMVLWCGNGGVHRCSQNIGCNWISNLCRSMDVLRHDLCPAAQLNSASCRAGGGVPHAAPLRGRGCAQPALVHWRSVGRAPAVHHHAHQR
jgi:hypothetical protein